MLLEQTTARVSVHVQDVHLRDRCDLVLLRSRALLRIVDGELENVPVPLEGELVHWVDLVQVK